MGPYEKNNIVKIEVITAARVKFLTIKYERENNIPAKLNARKQPNKISLPGDSDKFLLARNNIGITAIKNGCMSDFRCFSILSPGYSSIVLAFLGKC